MWYGMDDGRVSQVSEKVALYQQAYMVFYVREAAQYGMPQGPSAGEVSRQQEIEREAADVALKRQKRIEATAKISVVDAAQPTCGTANKELEADRYHVCF